VEAHPFIDMRRSVNSWFCELCGRTDVPAGTEYGYPSGCERDKAVSFWHEVHEKLGLPQARNCVAKSLTHCCERAENVEHVRFSSAMPEAWSVLQPLWASFPSTQATKSAQGSPALDEQRASFLASIVAPEVITLKQLALRLSQLTTP
jgi:hypothetical protein